eukprot:scaffold108454_cov37-Cyclotella_meneghiniana.AAC.1
MNDEKGRIIHTCYHDDVDHSQCDRLGKSIGRNTSIRELKLNISHSDHVVGYEVHDSLEAFYEGVEGNGYVETLDLHIDVFSDSYALPAFDLLNAQFKENLMCFTLRESRNMSNNQSLMIASVLETMSLERFKMCLESSFLFSFTNDSSYVRIISACSKVKALDVGCNTTSQYAATAALIGNPTSLLRELKVSDEVMSHENLSIIAAGLTGNTMLKKLTLDSSQNIDMSSIANLFWDALGAASSIEKIYNSNHTLDTLEMKDGIYSFTDSNIEGCLELNKMADKDEVIREKIARYYFVGDFPTSPFATMPVLYLPRVLSMIKCGDARNRQSAIFRLLKYIPELCDVSSRNVGGT